MKHIFTKQYGINAIESMRDIFEVKLATQFYRVKGTNGNMKCEIRNWNILLKKIKYSTLNNVKIYILWLKNKVNYKMLLYIMIIAF